VVSKYHKSPPWAWFCMRGRWRQRKRSQNAINSLLGVDKPQAQWCYSQGTHGTNKPMLSVANDERGGIVLCSLSGYTIPHVLPHAHLPRSFKDGEQSLHPSFKGRGKVVLAMCVGVGSHTWPHWQWMHPRGRLRSCGVR
jgi:hypothetical protein